MPHIKNRPIALLCVVLFYALTTQARATSTAPNAIPSPSPTPAATPTPTPAYSISGVQSDYFVETNNPNATGALDTVTGSDLRSRADIANLLIVLSKNTGAFRFGVAAGLYALPVVGQAINPTGQGNANANLYSLVPQAYVSFVPNANVTISAGKLASLLGQESAFTYQNANIQRGLGWAAEPSFSRGVRVGYVQGKFTGDLEYNDGFYSGSHRAVEGLLGWAPSPATGAQFAFIVPDRDTPGNATAGIANKAEYDFMFTQQIGKLALTPYVLLVVSPSSSALGYGSSQSATAISMIATYAYTPSFSVAARVENFVDHSATTDSSLNADLLGYGPGSGAATFTVTPQYKTGMYFARAEFSKVTVWRFTQGTAFGATGSNGSQSRFALELGAQF